MRIATERDYGFVESLLSDAEIKAGARIPEDKTLAIGTIVSAGCTILVDDHGCFIIKPLSPNQVDVHTLFERGFRGAYASRCVKDGLLWIFTATDVTQVFTKVHHSQKGVKLFTCAMGFSRYDEDNEFAYYKLDLLDWIKESPELQDEGKRFQAMLRPEAQGGKEVPFLGRTLGFVFKCIEAGLPFRGIALYNPIAETHQWQPVLVKSVEPLTLIFDGMIIQTMGSGVEVLGDVCQQQR